MKTFGEFEEITKDAALLREPRLEGLRVRLLRTALDFYRELQASLEGDASPGARSQLSEAYARAGKVTWELGRPEEALAAMRQSLALVEQMAAASPDDPRVKAVAGEGPRADGFHLPDAGPAGGSPPVLRASPRDPGGPRPRPSRGGPVPRGPLMDTARTSA